jgi:hypothetical protein
MRLFDKNETLQPPEGYEIVALSAEGSYLRVEYRRQVARTSKFQSWSTVVVFLNDYGREVVRTEDTVEEKFPEPHVVAPLTAAMQFKNGLFLILAGISEVIACLKKW